MMRELAILLCVLSVATASLAAAALGAAPTRLDPRPMPPIVPVAPTTSRLTQPVTQPAPTTAAVRTEDMEPIGDGTIRYQPPAGWTLVGKSADGWSATYKSDDDVGVLTVTVTPQERTLLPSAKPQMASIIGKGIRDAAARDKRTIELQPRVEPDERYFLKLHDIIRVGDDRVADRIQYYRILGLNLVHLACTAQVESREQSQPWHTAGEQLLDTMRVARGAKRSVYPKAQLRGIVPLDWREQKSDQPNGLMATYTDPKNPSRQIIVRTRILPKDARDPGPKRDAILERMVDDDRRQPPTESATTGAATEQPTTQPADKFLKQVRTMLQRGGETLRVETRYLVVGDVLASVRSVALEADAETAGKIADQAALDLKPIRE